MTIRKSAALAAVLVFSACTDQITGPIVDDAPVRPEPMEALDQVPTTMPTPSVEYRLYVGGGDKAMSVRPVKTSDPDVAAFYSYGDPVGFAGHSGYEVPEAVVLMLHEDASGVVSLVAMYDGADETPFEVTLTLSGLPEAAAFTVTDDPAEPGADWIITDGEVTMANRGAACCSDGWAITGGLDEPFEVLFTFQKMVGIDEMRWLQPDGRFIEIPSASWSELRLVAGNPAPETCAAGYYNDGQRCVAAPPGTMVPLGGAMEATLCPLGSYQPDPAGTSCIAAPVGTYVDTQGAVAPTACPAGTSTVGTGSTSADACLPFTELLMIQVADAIAAGTLEPAGSGKRFERWQARVEQAIGFLAGPQHQAGCVGLREAVRLADGQPSPADWVAGPATAAIVSMIQLVLDDDC